SLYKLSKFYFFVNAFLDIMSQYNEEEKRRAISLLVQQKSSYKVASITKISVTTIKSWRKECLGSIPTMNRGRPSKLSVQNKRHCIRMITSGKVESSKKSFQIPRTGYVNKS